MTREGVGFPFGIGRTDPRSQMRDLGHPSVITETVGYFALLPLQFAAGKPLEHLPTSIAGVLRLRAVKPLFAVDLRSASLRMTTLLGFRNLDGWI